MEEPVLLRPLARFASALTSNFEAAAVNPAQAEDQLKGPTQLLLQEAAEQLDLDAVARVEATGLDAVRPDIGVSSGGLLVGHVELKAPGKGARASAFTNPHDRAQFRRLADHPNLVYSDGNEWALYRRGTPVGRVVRAAGDVREDGASTFDAANALAIEALLRDFFSWEPIVPASPRSLAEALAPLTRLLRENVQLALATPDSALARLADDWRDFFFPEADDAQFADAYAQTVTYALLLARVEGESDLHGHAAERLDRRQQLLAQVLRVLAEPAARQEVDVPMDLLERAIAAVDPEILMQQASGRDVWLYFYEDFLAAYDNRLRRQRGVYYTPPPVVRAQTSLVSELLRDRFERRLGFADDDVVVLDPAVGTGTYLLAAMDAGLSLVRETYGAGAIGGRASVVARNFHGFELMVGPYAVAHLRLSQHVAQAGGALPAEGAHIYLTDTLESPNAAPPGFAHAPLFHEKLAQENERARQVKAETPVMVCLGNPPYFRQVIEPGEEGVGRQGGWVRRDDHGDVGILRDFLRDTPGVHAKNLYNLYVYFWRWALWKVFESGPRRGVVSFISASSYLRGPGFAGMRRHMRETFDDLWILDLGGESRGARASENVFEIRTPVTIAVGVRDGPPQPETPARVHYARIDGTREEKYARLLGIDGFADVAWQRCYADWLEPFLPTSEADFFSWPLLTDIFPWQHSGVQLKRTWPIAPDRETLERRWRALVEKPPAERGRLLRETGARRADRGSSALHDETLELPALAALDASEPAPASVPYAYRSLDRQFCLADPRLIDRPRPPLWKVTSARQLFMTSLLTGLLGAGPAAIATALVPDLDHFRGSYGAKHVIPLWRDNHATAPNLTRGLLEALADELDRPISPDDVFAYCYAILSAPGYMGRFADELEVPGPRLPITRDAGLFARAVELGRRLVWLHTYGERYVPDGRRAGEIPPGAARAVKGVPTTKDDYPSRHRYDEDRGELHVGEGVFAPVRAEVRRYSVSGLDVVGSWLDYRMKEGAGRRSSPLDAIRPEVWSAAFTEELLRLLWIVEHTVALSPALDETLSAIVAGDCIAATELPTPTEAERSPPD